MSPLPATAGLLFIASMTFVAVPGAQAQSGRGAPPLPLAIDLKKVPVGSWGDYLLITGTMRPLRQRISLVGKAGNGYELEVAVAGGPVPSTIVTRVELNVAAGAGQRVKRAVMKAGARLPMEIPGSSDLVAGQFPPIDPKGYLSTQEIEVPAGRFKAKLYRTVAAGGVKTDTWVSEEARPLGVVKVEITFPRAGAAKAILKLVAQGTGAKGTVLKPVRVFDENKLAGEMMADMKKAAAAARPGPLKSPH